MVGVMVGVPVVGVGVPAHPAAGVGAALGAPGVVGPGVRVGRPRAGEERAKRPACRARQKQNKRRRKKEKEKHKRSKRKKGKKKERGG